MLITYFTGKSLTWSEASKEGHGRKTVGAPFRRGLFINVSHIPMAKMTKSQLYAVLAEETGKSKKEVGEFLDTLTTMAYKEVKNNGEFAVPGIGKLVKVHRAARMGRNPATGEQIQIPAKTVVKFRVAKAAKDAVL